jgi:hypothetical protein
MMPAHKVRRRAARNGGAMLEAALFIPILVLLLVGMVQIGKITYIYYTLRQTLYAVGRYAATQQGVDFCDPNDPTIVGAINLGLTGTGIDPGTDPILPALTSDMISVNAERIDPTSGVPAACDCSISGCDTNSGGGEPDFVTVSIPQGYSVTPVIPGVALPNGPILLKPTVRIPFGGT